MVKMNLPSSDNQANSVGRLAVSRMGAYESAMQAIGSFVGADSLSGQAYTNAKNYASNTLLPLLRAAVLYEEALSEAVKRLPSDYCSTPYLEGKSLDSEVLRDELDRLEMVGDRLQGSIERALDMARDYPDQEWHAHSMMRQLSRVVDRKNKLRRQIQALHAFDNRSSGFFTDFPDLEVQLAQGISQVSSDMSTFSGTFPSGLSPAWVSKVNDQWNERVKRMRDTSSPADFRKLEEKLRNDSEEHDVEKIKLLENAYKQFKEIMDSDTASRVTQVLALLPKQLINNVLASDGLWELLAEIEKKGIKGAKAVDYILEGLSKYERFGEKIKSVTNVIDNASDYLQTAATPLKEGTKKVLEKLSGFEYLDDAVTKGKNLVGNGKFLGKAVKVLGKVGTVFTFAQFGFEGISGGIEEFSKTKHLGKAVWGGFLDAVSSVGPLEGATLGASIGGMFGTAIPIPIVGTVSGAAIGGTIGLVVGGVNSLVQFFNPNFYDDLKDASYSAIDQSEKFINDVGKKIGGITNMISDSFTGFGKAIGFG